MDLAHPLFSRRGLPVRENMDICLSKKCCQVPDSDSEDFRISRAGTQKTVKKCSLLYALLNALYYNYIRQLKYVINYFC